VHSREIHLTPAGRQSQTSTRRRGFWAYNVIHGEYPDIIRNGPSNDNQSTSGSDEEWLTDDLVEDALDHLDPDVGYAEWRDIAFAVHDYDSGAIGQALFDDWSSGGEQVRQECKASSRAVLEADRQGKRNHRCDADLFTRPGVQDGFLTSLRRLRPRWDSEEG